jgi:D-galactarolactone cycloisomerase
MRITAVDAIAIDIPLSKNFGGSTYSVLKRSTVITRLRTDDGLVSEIYNGDNRAHGPQIAHMITNDLLNVVKGLSIFERELAWQRMFALTHAAADKKLLLEAI